MQMRFWDIFKQNYNRILWFLLTSSNIRKLLGGLAKLSTEVKSWVKVVPILSFQQRFGQFWRFQPLFGQFWRVLKELGSTQQSFPSICPLPPTDFVCLRNIKQKYCAKKTLMIHLLNNAVPSFFLLNPTDPVC